MTVDYDEIIDEIRNTGFFSEYLPPCFKLNKNIFNYLPPKNCDLIQPYCFTMSRFNKNDSRRRIYVPEIASYVVLHDFMKKNSILEKIIAFTKTKNYSFSPILWSDNTIVRHEQCYNLENLNEQQNFKQRKSNYIENIVEKIIRAKGAKKVVKLDISNCYSSIYTHMIPAIILGYDLALEEYKKVLNKEELNVNKDFILFSELDERIRKQRLNRTNGLLVGPLYSKIIAEGLLTRIDIELESLKINFCRYVDDYEVFIYDDNEKSVISNISNILNKYGFSLNTEKTEVLEFPYYIVTNLNKIIEKYNGKKDNDSEKTMELFNNFLQMEKDGVKGAIRFLLKTLEKNPIYFDNHELYRAYLLSILQNDERSLSKACSLLIADSKNYPFNKEEIELVYKLLKIHIRKEHDLEVLWLLYFLIITKNINSNDSIKVDILNSNNELAQIMFLSQNLLSKEDTNQLSGKAKSWILLYELYAYHVFSEDKFIEKLKLEHSKDFYKKINNNNIHFCNWVK